MRCFFLPNPLEPTPSNFVDHTLRDRKPCQIYQVKLAGFLAQIHLLFKHQSTPVWMMPFGLSKYGHHSWGLLYPLMREVTVLIGMFCVV